MTCLRLHLGRLVLLGHAGWPRTDLTTLPPPDLALSLSDLPSNSPTPGSEAKATGSNGEEDNSNGGRNSAVSGGVLGSEPALQESLLTSLDFTQVGRVA